MPPTQSQIVVLAAQICRSVYMEAALQTMANTDLYACIQPLEAVLKSAEQTLTMLADFMVKGQSLLELKTLEHLLSTAAKLHNVTHFVYKRDMARFLLESSINGPRDSRWLRQMDFCFVSRQPVVLRQLSVHMTNVPFSKGVEHLCVQDKPVKTPLTDRCCLTMTQTLEARPAGLPFATRAHPLATAFTRACAYGQQGQLRAQPWSSGARRFCSLCARLLAKLRPCQQMTRTQASLMFSWAAWTPTSTGYYRKSTQP